MVLEIINVLIFIFINLFLQVLVLVKRLGKMIKFIASMAMVVVIKIYVLKFLMKGCFLDMLADERVWKC